MEIEGFVELPLEYEEEQQEEENQIETEEEGEEIELELPEKSLKNRFTNQRKKLILLFACALVLLLCIIAIIIPTTIFSISNDSEKPNESMKGQNLGLVIDLGSSGSRISVFGWDKDHVVQPFPYGSDSFYYSARNIGISKYDDPDEAANSIDPLLSYGEKAVLESSVRLNFIQM